MNTRPFAVLNSPEEHVRVAKFIVAKSAVSSKHPEKPEIGLQTLENSLVNQIVP
jgi:hypothetical protein